MKRLYAAVLMIAAAALLYPHAAEAKLVTRAARFTFQDVNHPPISFTQTDSTIVAFGVKNSKACTDTTAPLDVSEATFNSGTNNTQTQDSTLAIRLILECVQDVGNNSSLSDSNKVTLQGSWDGLLWSNLFVTSAAQSALLTLTNGSNGPGGSASVNLNTVHIPAAGRILAVPIGTSMVGVKFVRAVVTWDPNAGGASGQAIWEYIVPDGSGTTDMTGTPVIN